jgi:schlafen family protein
MKPPRATVWLQDLLSGKQPEPQDLERLIDECGPESEHHDYKSGLVGSWKPTDPKNAPALLRKYVSGFANSDGGFFVIGYNEKAQQVDGFKPPGGGSAHDWATRTLSDLYLSPAPRIRVVRYDGPRLRPSVKGPVDVLIVTSERASVLVPCREGSRWIYYLRLGDSTLEAPPYLVADLLLHRRARPTLGIPRDGVVVQFDLNQAGSIHGAPVYRLAFFVTVANEGFIAAEGVRVGVLAWSVQYERLREPTSFLRTRVEAWEPDPRIPGAERDVEWRLAHTYFPEIHGVEIQPFASYTFDLVDRQPSMAMRSGQIIRPGTAEIALYAIARNSEPWWFQLRTDIRLRENASRETVTAEPCGTRVPVISWTLAE